MARLPRCYWDSSCFLAWLKPEPDRYSACNEVLRACERGDLLIVTSAISLTEVVKLNKGPVEIPAEAERMITLFFQREYIVIQQVTRFIAEEARRLIWAYPKLRAKDAVHAATAAFGRIRVLHTFDRDFLPLDGRIGAPPLEISEPHMPQRSLPFETPDGDADVDGDE